MSAHAGEMAAAGPQRVPAFRTMRALLGGSCAAGYSYAQLAQCLGVRVETLRARAITDDWIRDQTFAELAAVHPATVRRWQRQGRLSEVQTDDTGARYYLASELIRALCGHKLNHSGSQR